MMFRCFCKVANVQSMLVLEVSVRGFNLFCILWVSNITHLPFHMTWHPLKPGRNSNNRISRQSWGSALRSCTHGSTYHYIFFSISSQLTINTYFHLHTADQDHREFTCRNSGPRIDLRYHLRSARRSVCAVCSVQCWSIGVRTYTN